MKLKYCTLNTAQSKQMSHNVGANFLITGQDVRDHILMVTVPLQSSLN